MNENSTQLEMFKLLRTMQEEIENMNTNKEKSTKYKPTKNGRKTTDNPRFTRSKTDMYCWTHGGCAHAGATCNDKDQRHKNNATFKNWIEVWKTFCP